ncbi:hypothetical protein QR680_015338 [Steinernema hermaphroditum]|uniref:Uncharacterized protein n=1 Tax=Steinernema hermaphroditum TaxID=289476 RepID=A0AA39H7C7_9BILA|nr:hypothetical protein QR680_015338 [Steinernema hermaphroditum]
MKTTMNATTSAACPISSLGKDQMSEKQRENVFSSKQDAAGPSPIKEHKTPCNSVGKNGHRLGAVLLVCLLLFIPVEACPEKNDDTTRFWERLHGTAEKLVDEGGDNEFVKVWQLILILVDVIGGYKCLVDYDKYTLKDLIFKVLQILACVSVNVLTFFYYIKKYISRPKYEMEFAVEFYVKYAEGRSRTKRWFTLQVCMASTNTKYAANRRRCFTRALFCVGFCKRNILLPENVFSSTQDAPCPPPIKDVNSSQLRPWNQPNRNVMVKRLQKTQTTVKSDDGMAHYCSKWGDRASQYCAQFCDKCRTYLQFTAEKHIVADQASESEFVKGKYVLMFFGASLSFAFVGVAFMLMSDSMKLGPEVL